MNKKGANYKILLFILIGIILVAGIIFAVWKFWPSSDSDIPYSFLAVHFELDPNPNIEKGGANPADVWQNIVNTVDLANQYNTPLTIMFWPGSAEYALASPERMAQVREWQTQGHEIGIHDQGCSIDGVCSGSAACHQESNNLLYARLAGNYTITAGTPGCSSTVISTFKYQGGGRPDGRNSVAIKYTYPSGREVYNLNMKAGYAGGTALKIAQYKTLNSNEIYGFVDHGEGDAGNLGGSKELRQWLQFLYEKDPEGKKRMTLSNIMEKYVLPNNLVVTMSDICSSADSRIQQCLQLDRTSSNSTSCMGLFDTGAFNFGRCLHTGTYCAFVPEQCTGITYEPTSCVVTPISDYPSIGSCTGRGKIDTGAITKPPIDESKGNKTSSACGDGICDGLAGEKTSCPSDCVAPTK
jgi:hypothetical protein